MWFPDERTESKKEGKKKGKEQVSRHPCTAGTKGGLLHLYLKKAFQGRENSLSRQEKGEASSQKTHQLRESL